MKIGITIWESKGGTQFVINKAYVDYVSDAGYDVILIPPKSNIEDIANICDGLVLPGGIDVDPIFYDEENVASYATDPIRDDFERQLLYAFLGLNKPIFGICRGFQLIFREFLRHNEEYYGYFSFYQHVNNHSLAQDFGISRNNPSHSVYALKNILYGEEIKKTSKMYVNSMHHQGVVVEFPEKKNMTIDNVIVSAITRYGLEKKEKGYIVEAFHINNWSGGGVRAVQWHPEELKDYALLHTFFGNTTENGQVEG